MSGHLTAKSDVYSFGVVLLEILSGRRAVDKTRPSREQHLVEHMRSWLKDPQKLSRVMDPALEGQYFATAAHKAALVAYKCLSGNPKNRPDMCQVVKDLEPLLNVTDDVSDESVAPIAPIREDNAVRKERTARRRPGERDGGKLRQSKMRSPQKVVRRRPGQSEEFWVWHMPGEVKC